MKKLIYCLVAMCCILSFVGCDKNREREANIIKLSYEDLTRKIFNGDDVTYNYQCQFATDVKFEIMVKNSSTVLHKETTSITPGEGTLKFNIETGGYEGQALLCITYHAFSFDKGVSTYFWDVTITNEGSWYYHTEAINELLETCKDFDAETLIAGIEGKWETDSLLIYDDEWKSITTPLLVMGEDHVNDRAYSFFIFAADGTGSRYVHYPEPDVEPETLKFSWAYDAESGKLTLSGDYNNEWNVMGYSDYYVVLDQISREGWNYRTILKRKAE